MKTADLTRALCRLNPWRFKGMIKPNMALSYGDSKLIYEARGINMVDYLRARRAGNRNMKAFFRNRYLDNLRMWK